MPSTSRKRRGSISSATSLSQRAGHTNFSTAQRSRRKSKTTAESLTNLVDSEEKTEEIERQLPISPDLPLRPPFLVNKTPFGENATGLQLHPPLHSSARPLFGLRTPANENSTSTSGILGSRTLLSADLFLGGVGNRFSVSKSKNGMGIATQGEQGEIAPRRANFLLPSSSLMKPTKSFHPPIFSNPLPVPLTSFPLQQQPLSSPPLTSLIHHGGERSHTQFGLGSPLVIRPRTKYLVYNRLFVFALLVSVVLSFVFLKFEYQLHTSRKTGYLESFLSKIPSLSNRIAKLLDIDNEPNVSISLVALKQSQMPPDGVRQQNIENECETLIAAVDEVRTITSHAYSSYESEVINMSTVGEVSESGQENDVFYIAAKENMENEKEEVLEHEISANASPKGPIQNQGSSSVLALSEDINVDINTNFLLIELQKLKDDLTAERLLRETMVIAMEAKIKASFEECQVFRDAKFADHSFVDSERLKKISEADSIRKDVADVDAVKEKMSIKLEETVDFINQIKQQLNESAQNQLKLMSEMLGVAIEASERANFAAVNASEFAASSFIAAENASSAASNASISASVAASAVTSISMASTSGVNSHIFDKSDSAVSLSELQVAFSAFNATIYEDINNALQRREESTSIVHGVNSLAESSQAIDFRLDGLLSLLKETRADLTIQAASLEDLKVATSNSLVDIALLQKHRSDVDDLKTLVPSLLDKIDLNEYKYEKFIIDLSELKTIHDTLSMRVEEDEIKVDAHKTILDEMISSISSLRMRFEESEKTFKRTSSIVEEMNTSMDTILKRTDKYDESFDALPELKSTVTSLSMKMDESDNEVNDSVLEDLRTSMSALLKKFDEFEKIEADDDYVLAELHASISTLKANVTNLSNAMAAFPDITSFNSSLLESAIHLNEVSIAQLRNESIWIEKRLREVIKSQKVNEVAISERFLEVGDTLEFLTESLFNQSLNISYLFDLVRSHDVVLNASTVDRFLNDCNKSHIQKQQRADVLLSDSLLFRVLRSASMPPSIYDASFPRNLVRHTWADGISFDGIAALAVSNEPLTEYATLTDVAKLIDMSLAMVAADHGVPLPDYALAQGGAEIISHLTSSSWLNAEALIGASEEVIAELELASSPYNALQPIVSEGAGHCWPMAGSSGRLTVRLKTPIHVTAITIDHLPPSVAPVRQIRGMDNSTSVDIASQQRSTSALKRSILYGLSGESEDDEENKILLGSFEFDASNEAPPTQTFHLEKSTFIERNGGESDEDRGEMEAATPIVMLHVLDNHGLPDYTCIYRFRVHGYVVPGR